MKTERDVKLRFRVIARLMASSLEAMKAEIDARYTMLLINLNRSAN